jgi:hypothetical protein
MLVTHHNMLFSWRKSVSCKDIVIFKWPNARQAVAGTSDKSNHLNEGTFSHIDRKTTFRKLAIILIRILFVKPSSSSAMLSSTARRNKRCHDFSRKNEQLQMQPQLFIPVR